MASLKDKVAVVTGAARGIGFASAELLAKEGASVILADVDENAAAKSAADLVSAGFSACHVQVDVAREADVIKMIGLALTRFGSLDILFNNAGIAGEEAPTTGVTLDLWDRIMAVNLTGTFLAMKHGIAAMLESGGGSVINNASVLGLVGLPNYSAYSASKGGVIQLTKTAALEFATKGVRVNCICPGFVETAMVNSKDAPGVDRSAFFKVLEPMRRLGKPQEIAELVLFLATSQSSFMTGAILPVDGGYIAR